MDCGGQSKLLKKYVRQNLFYNQLQFSIPVSAAWILRHPAGIQLFYQPCPMVRSRKVTTWARVQGFFGEKCVLSVPEVMPFSTAQHTAL